MANVFAARLVALKDPNTILNMTAAIYSQTPFFDIQLRNAVLTHVQQNLDSILSEEDTSSVLLGNTELNLDILRRIAPILQEQAQALRSSDSSQPTTPKKRKSPRIGSHVPGSYRDALGIRTR